MIRQMKDFCEFGKNSNGSWVRYANGLQMCWVQHVAGSVAVNNAWGSNYYGLVTAPNFPQVFIEVPTITCVPMNDGGTSGCWTMVRGEPTTIKWMDYYCLRSTVATFNVIAHLTAIGRWK